MWKSADTISGEVVLFLTHRTRDFLLPSKAGRMTSFHHILINIEEIEINRNISFAYMNHKYFINIVEAFLIV